MKAYTAIGARVLATLLAILAVHWVARFGHWYFFVIASAAILLLLSEMGALPRPRLLAARSKNDRLAMWIVLVCLAVIGGLHNANTWTAEGRFLRPLQLSLWKTELVLVISLAAPLCHWLASEFVPRMAPVDGRRFATEFALYVNFSGIALVLWTGQATVSGSTLAAALALVLLAELTLHAST